LSILRDGDQKTIHEQFADFARVLLNGSYLTVRQGQRRFRIFEIEYYLTSRNHPDLYNHCDLMQLKANQFYPHRFKTGTFKKGTYKCLDFTFGGSSTDASGDDVSSSSSSSSNSSVNSKDVYGSALIRSIEDMETGQCYTGPCNCVKALLSLYECSEWDELIEKGYDIQNEFSMLPSVELEQRDLYCGKRVGLNTTKYPSFVAREYRFATNLPQIKKQKKFRIC
jgi:hypothetical protein